VSPSRKIVVMIPTLNEEHSLGKVIDTIPMKEFHERGFLVEVIVVDGRSMDNTREVALSRGARVYVQEGNGKGLGVRQAFSLSHPQEVVLKALSGKDGAVGDLYVLSTLLDSQYLLMLDGDGTYPSRYLVDLVDTLEEGKDVVMGSRFRGKIMSGAMSRLNYLGNLALSATASILYMHPCSDVCTGLWGFRLDAIRAMDLDSDRFELEAEMYAVSVRNHLRLTEIPIDYYPREGESKLIPINSGTMIFRKLLQRRFISASVERFSGDPETDMVRMNARVRPRREP
jgi:glycosyltransferase involved in cell wall biosynthesis